MVHSVNGGVLRLISPYVHVRLESTLAGFAVLAAPVIDDAWHNRRPHAVPPFTLDPIPCF